ncbi:hypothetical protein [Microvirga sp. G4-2]|uniref:hypothetical protein n=1 Tax=Microvirga sp. G4-2 TaxID=3434467 RepID=UPI004044EDA5
MRLPVALACLLAAAPAAASDVMQGETWTAEAHVVKDGVSRDTILYFRRAGPGYWDVSVECQVTDVRTRKWTSHKGGGVARMQAGFVHGTARGLGEFVVARDMLSMADPRCASGPVTFSTGD